MARGGAGQGMNVAVHIRAYDHFSRQFKRLRSELDRLDGASGAAMRRTGDRPGVAFVRAAEDRQKAVVAHHERAAKVSAATAGGLSSASTSAMISPLGIPPALLGAGAAAYGLKDVITAASTFESQLVSIRKKAGTTAEETARIGKDALDLAASGQVATSVDEVMAAYDRAAAAGLPIEDMREFAKQSAMAADAFEMSAEDVGNAAAGFRTAFGIDQKGVGDLFDVINTVADSGIASERDLINFLDRAGANLKLFGMTKEQSAGLGGSLLNLKMAPDVAARAMNTLTTKLLSPGSDKSQAGLENIVGNMRQFRRLLKEKPNEAFVEFLDKVAALDKFEAAEYLTQFLGQGFSDEVQRLADARQELQRMQAIAQDKSLTQGSLGRAYDLQLQTMESKWKIFAANLQRLKIDLGSLILPPATDAIGDLTNNVRQLREVIAGVHTTWDVLRSAVGKGIDFDPMDPWGRRPGQEADAAGRRSIEALLEKSPKDPAAGAFAARDVEGVTQGKLLAAGRNALRRRFDETPTEVRENAYQTKNVLGFRSAEAASMQALKEQFGTYLAPDGQSFRPGTDAMELVDEALGQFAGAVLTTVAVIDAKTKAPGELPLHGPIPRDRASGTPAFGPVPTFRPSPEEMAQLQSGQAAASATATVDTTSATTNLATLQAAKAQASAPIESVADINISPAMAKLNTLWARAQQVMGAINRSASMSDAGMSQFESAVGDEF